MASPLAAASACASVARIASDSNSLAIARQPVKEATGDTSFASVLKEAIGAVAEMGRKSDTQARAAANGKANIVEVNPLPGILPDISDNSCLPKAARAAGLSYDELIGACLVAAAARQGVALTEIHA